jgi:hypothetical protein
MLGFVPQPNVRGNPTNTQPSLYYFEVDDMIDLSKLKWLKNIKDPSPKIWAYDKLDEMPISEARIFRLHWRDQKYKDNAQRPLKGDLVALVQLAKVTHIVEMLEDGDMVYGNTEKKWSIYRIVKAIWMPPEGFDWRNLPHQKDIFGIKNLPQDGQVHEIPTNAMYSSEHWKEVGGLQGFQQNFSKLLTEIS